ncbi:MAG: hypothetical protein E7190_10385 [Erysipelotrichaceae bacterium]|nr:hypothetical protein [Erysipelotrichaceae bacterium]
MIDLEGKTIRELISELICECCEQGRSLDALIVFYTDADKAVNVPMYIDFVDETGIAANVAKNLKLVLGKVDHCSAEELNDLWNVLVEGDHSDDR